MNWTRRLVVTAAVAVLGLGVTVGPAARPAAAQGASREAVTNTKIQQQLTTGVELIHQTLAAFGDPAKAAEICYRAYQQFRAAHSNMEKQIRATRQPKPQYQVASPRLYRARMNVLQARAALRLAGSDPRQLAVAEAKLRDALKLTQLVQATSL